MITAALLKRHPWRFDLGQAVYVRGWSQDTTALITAKVATSDVFPHYLVVDADGKEWRIPQIHLSTSPIIERV